MGDIDWLRLSGLRGGLMGGDRAEEEEEEVGGTAPGIVVMRYGSTLESDPVRK